MADYTEMCFIVIPITLRNVASRLAVAIMPDINEDGMFDSIRLSLTGNEPATHLMTVCPMTKAQAEQWRQLTLPSSSKPNDYPTRSVDGTDITAFLPMRLDPLSISAITDRIDNRQVKPTKAVRLISSSHNDLRSIDNFGDVLSRLGLARIVENDLR